MSIFRTEHPSPQSERKDWQCLNGQWDFGYKKEETYGRIKAVNAKTAEIEK